MTIIRRLTFVLPVALGVALLWWASANRPPPTVIEAEERRTPVAYIEVTPQAFTPEVSGFGEVSPARIWSAVTQVAGRVSYVNENFVRGGAVTKGEVLVEIASDDYRLTVARAEADIRSAEARVDEIQLSETTTGASLAIERKALELLQRDLERITELEERGATSPSTVE